jgi:hypothetical protein
VQLSPEAEKACIPSMNGILIQNVQRKFMKDTFIVQAHGQSKEQSEIGCKNPRLSISSSQHFAL